MSCEKQPQLEPLQAVARQVSSSSASARQHALVFTSLIPKELSQYFKMPDHYQLVRIMNQAILELACKAP